MFVNFLRYKKIYFIFFGTLILASVVSLFVFKLNLGIDFTGGSIIELNYQGNRPSNQEIRDTLAGIDLGDIYIQPSAETGVIIRMKDVSEEIHQEIVQKLNGASALEERRFESIGPTIGQELKNKTVGLIIIALFSIVLYIAIAFWKVKRPISGWQYGIASLFALFHDVLIPLGVFSILGKFYGIQVTIPVVVALLTVVGYSVNNVVVVFDRIRENLIKRAGATFVDTVELSLNQTLARCINTSLTTLLVLFAIFFFGGETLKYFTLALIIGIVAGTVSAIFLASPILVVWSNRRKI